MSTLGEGSSALAEAPRANAKTIATLAERLPDEIPITCSDRATRDRRS
jgi:hypothetical protein